MATVFEQSPDGFFDKTAGMRMREEIYSVGDSRDINVSIEKFLGRPRSLEPFLEKIGVHKTAAAQPVEKSGQPVGTKTFWHRLWPW